IRRDVFRRPTGSGPEGRRVYIRGVPGERPSWPPRELRRPRRRAHRAVWVPGSRGGLPYRSTDGMSSRPPPSFVEPF
ncbi:hypothetical protein IscW_ISCW022277, partial [Ixodes scapularis]